MTIIPVSTKNYGGEDKFEINVSDPDFGTTGLDETSFVYGHPALNIPESAVLKSLGHLTGDLKIRFIKWNG